MERFVEKVEARKDEWRVIEKRCMGKGKGDEARQAEALYLLRLRREGWREGDTGEEGTSTAPFAAKGQ